MLTDMSKVQSCEGEPEASSDSRLTGSVCAVAITPGDRRHLVRPVLQALLRQAAIWKIVLVTNGVRWDMRSFVNDLDAEPIEAIELERNRGSAAAYAAGIKRACDLGAEFIWLLDGDNEPEDRALCELCSAYQRLNEKYPRDRLAVAGLETAPKMTWESAADHLEEIPRDRSLGPGVSRGPHCVQGDIVGGSMPFSPLPAGSASAALFDLCRSVQYP